MNCKKWIQYMFGQPKDERTKFWEFIYKSIHNSAEQNYELKQEIKQLNDKIKELKKRK